MALVSQTGYWPLNTESSLTWRVPNRRFWQMLATQISAVAARAPVGLPLETVPAWKEIIGSAEPFPQRVARSLAEQTEAFDSEIAVYARYALTVQGQQLRASLVAMSAGPAGQTEY